MLQRRTSVKTEIQNSLPRKLPNYSLHWLFCCRGVLGSQIHRNWMIISSVSKEMRGSTLSFTVSI